MSEISKGMKALLRFLEGVSDVVSEIKDEDDFRKIKKPSTLEDCHDLIDGFFHYSLVMGKTFSGVREHMLESLNAHSGKLND